MSAKQRESYIQGKVVSYARKLGWLCFKWVVFNFSGLPDYIMFGGGQVLLIEFKAPGEEPTKRQVIVHKRFARAGFQVHIIDDITKGKELIDANA